MAEDDFQTLFWVPVLQSTADNATAVVTDMLDLIADFHAKISGPVMRPSIVVRGNQHRQVILGDMLDVEVSKTFVEVVPKSENTRYKILISLKVRSLTDIINVHFFTHCILF